MSYQRAFVFLLMAFAVTAHGQKSLNAESPLATSPAATPPVNSNATRPQSAIQTAEPIPDFELYLGYFSKVQLIERHSAQLKANGQTTEYVQAYYAKDANLSSQETTVLKTVAQDCIAAVAAQDKKALPLIKAAREELRNSPGSMTTSVDAQVKMMQDERNQIILNHIQQLRDSFGAGSFQQFDAFVRASTATTIKHFSIPRRDRTPKR